MGRPPLRDVGDRARLLRRLDALEAALSEALEALEAVRDLDRELDHQVLTSRVSRLCTNARASARRILHRP